MRKFLTFFITPILLALLILIKIPDIENWLKTYNRYSGLYIGIGIAISTVFIHFINVISPLKKYEKIEKKKWMMLEAITGSSEDNYFKKNRLSVNVMTTKRCLFTKREPDKKNNRKYIFKLFGKVFRVLWSTTPIDKRLVFTINQGVSGMAYKYGKPVLIDIRNDGDSEMNLNYDQKKAIANLEFIISCPIFALDERYNNFSSKIIGILNVSSSYPKFRSLIESAEERSDLTNRVVDFSRICSLIM